MDLKIEGKIIKVLPEKTGEGANGNWLVQSWVLEETNTQYPKKVAFQAFNKHFTINEGDEVKVGINLESREYQEKWYTNVNAWKVDFLNKASQADSNPAPDPIPDPAVATETPQADLDDPGDDLPF